ncbi:MAG TPA: hypothetical protein VJ652_07410 [Noviherbaspirillum sp.]|nr:hypothetical protein [Noviherbaspirillum sp.]
MLDVALGWGVFAAAQQGCGVQNVSFMKFLLLNQTLAAVMPLPEDSAWQINTGWPEPPTRGHSGMRRRGRSPNKVHWSNFLVQCDAGSPRQE